nr:hypothetical protein [uncultured Jannaschia sp.]
MTTLASSAALQQRQKRLRHTYRPEDVRFIGGPDIVHGLLAWQVRRSGDDTRVVHQHIQMRNRLGKCRGSRSGALGIGDIEHEKPCVDPIRFQRVDSRLSASAIA